MKRRCSLCRCLRPEEEFTGKRRNGTTIGVCSRCRPLSWRRVKDERPVNYHGPTIGIGQSQPSPAHDARIAIYAAMVAEESPLECVETDEPDEPAPDEPCECDLIAEGRKRIEHVLFADNTVTRMGSRNNWRL